MTSWSWTTWVYGVVNSLMRKGSSAGLSAIRPQNGVRMGSAVGPRSISWPVASVSSATTFAYSRASLSGRSTLLSTFTSASFSPGRMIENRPLPSAT